MFLQMFSFKHIINELIGIKFQISLIHLCYFFPLLFLPVKAEHESPILPTKPNSSIEVRTSWVHRLGVHLRDSVTACGLSSAHCTVRVKKQTNKQKNTT